MEKLSIILDDYHIIVYPRISQGDIPKDLLQHKSVTKIDAPIMEISSTMIRNGIKEGKDLRYFMHHKVQEYIEEMNFYK